MFSKMRAGAIIEQVPILARPLRHDISSASREPSASGQSRHAFRVTSAKTPALNGYVSGDFEEALFHSLFAPRFARILAQGTFVTHELIF